MVAAVNQERTRWRSTGVLITIGLVVGVGLGVVAAWALRSTPEPTVDPVADSPPETVEAAEAFVEAWDRSRRETFLSVSELHRTTDAGELRLTLVLAQRPPDRVRSSGQSLTGTVGGVRVDCDEVVDEGLQCRLLEEARADYDADVATEVALLRRYVEGTLPLYRVSRQGECFDLRLARVMYAPPYGQRARFCFDPATGAPSATRIERIEGTDVVTLVTVSAEVSDADLDAVADGTFEPTG